MAQPIQLMKTQATEDDPGARLHQALDKHTDAIISALELLQVLHDRGVLDLLRGLVGAGNELVGMATSALDTPEAVGGIRNFMLLSKFFAGIPPDVLKSLVHAVEQGARHEKRHEAPSTLQLLGRLRSEDSRHAIAVTLDLLESVGKGL